MTFALVHFPLTRQNHRLPGVPSFILEGVFASLTLAGTLIIGGGGPAGFTSLASGASSEAKRTRLLLDFARSDPHGVSGSCACASMREYPRCTIVVDQASTAAVL
jgi:hypothetical protein